MPYQLGDASLFEDWRRVRDSNSQAHDARQFSRLRPYQLGLTLREIIWQERQDLNPHSSVLETDALIQLSYAPRKLVHGEGLAPSEATWTPDLVWELIGGLTCLKKITCVCSMFSSGNDSSDIRNVHCHARCSNNRHQCDLSPKLEDYRAMF